jgi:hypothetical protein
MPPLQECYITPTNFTHSDWYNCYCTSFATCPWAVGNIFFANRNRMTFTLSGNQINFLTSAKRQRQNLESQDFKHAKKHNPGPITVAIITLLLFPSNIYAKPDLDAALYNCINSFHDRWDRYYSLTSESFTYQENKVFDAGVYSNVDIEVELAPITEVNLFQSDDEWVIGVSCNRDCVHFSRYTQNKSTDRTGDSDIAFKCGDEASANNLYNTLVEY